MQVLNGVWRWLRDQVASATGHSPRRRRHEFTRPLSTFAAQVEKLESRELLTVTYHGGALLTNVETQAIYLGSDWKNVRADQLQMGQLEQFNSMLMTSKFMDGLTFAGYNVFRGSFSPGVVDNVTLDKSFTGGVTDAQLQTFVQGLINTRQVQQPDANRLYTIYVEPGVVITAADGSNSITSFLGYHSGFTGTTASGASLNIHYSVIAYPNFPNATYVSQGFGSSLNDLTKVTAHETAEAATDPDVWKANLTGDPTFLGWIDDFQGEVGDITNFGFNQMFNNFEIQAIADQNDQPISFNGVPSLVAPANIKLTSLATPGTAMLSWTGVALAEGYRVYAVNGPTKTLVGTTTAGTTSLKLTGLTAGTTKTYIVEVFDGASVVDSKSFTGIVPHAAAAPVKTAASTLTNAAAPVTSGVHSTTPATFQFFDGTEDRRRRAG